jgi:hypothetical protein
MTDQPLPDIDVWEQLPEELEDYYEWFSKYYLPLGFKRSLRQAYIMYMIDHTSPGEERLNITQPTTEWKMAAEKYEWKARALAYDQDRGDQATAAIKEAALKLRNATTLAVETLIAQLSSPRNGVQAAKEILDRGGLPAHTVSNVSQTVTISADDMARAAKEVEEWEQTLIEPNGSNVEQA